MGERRVQPDRRLVARDTPDRRNKGGRPRLADEPSSSITARLPASAHDRLIVLANKHEMSVSALVRRILIFQLDKKAS